MIYRLLQGAVNIAVELEKFFTDNNEKLDFMLDEGMFVMKDVFPGNNYNFNEKLFLISERISFLRNGFLGSIFSSSKCLLYI